MEKKVIFNLNNVMFEFIDSTRKPITEVTGEFKKQLAEFFYYSTSNLALRVFAMDLYKSDEVSVDRSQLDAMKVELPKMNLLNPALYSMTSYIDSLLAELDMEAAMPPKLDKPTKGSK